MSSLTTSFIKNNNESENRDICQKITTNETDIRTIEHKLNNSILYLTNDIESQLEFENIHSETTSTNSDLSITYTEIDLINENNAGYHSNNNTNRYCVCNFANRSCIVFVTLIFTGVLIVILSKFASIHR
jgi:hypothetical protein